MRGFVPRWGGGGAWQFAAPSHNSSFSYLGVPVATGMSDWYENRPLRQTLIGRLRHPFVYPAPHFVIAMKACPGLRSWIDSRL